MQTMGISQFKSHALKIIDKVAKTKEIIVITKRGKPLAQIIPYRDSISNHVPGKLADALVFENDIVSPLGEEMWDSAK
jgi:prevent-host-death family protein